jgi:3-hydroxypropanoate dehydrogenase
MNAQLNDSALDQLFRAARTVNVFLPRAVEPAVLRALHELLRWGPTSANSQPARFVLLVSNESRQRLLPALSRGNLEKTRRAPVTVIVAEDLRFFESLQRTFPHTNARAWFEGNPGLIDETARRNSSLQGAYLILAARALGLDCGPMSGFDAAKVDAEFFPDGRFRSNFLVNLGYGDHSALPPRLPRLGFDEACTVL